MTTTVSEHDVWPPDPATIDLNSRDWLTPSQAAGAARVSERTIWQLVADHDISIKLGGRRFVSRKRLFQALLAA